MNLIQSNIKTMSSRDLHKLISNERILCGESSPRVSDFNARIVDELEGDHYESFVVQNPNKTETKAFNLTIEQCTLIGMRESKSVRRSVLAKLKELEVPQLPQTYAAALLEAGRLAQELEETSAKLIEAQPKAEFYDQVTSSKDAVDMASAAKVLNMGIGRNKLFELLRDEKVLQGNNQPYQKYIDNGCFRVIESKFTKPNGDTSINLKTVVYQKGLTYISKLINKESNKLKGVK